MVYLKKSAGFPVCPGVAHRVVLVDKTMCNLGNPVIQNRYCNIFLKILFRL